MVEKYSRADISIFSTKTNASRGIPVKYALVPLLRLKNEYDFEDRKPDDFVFVNSKTRKKLYRNYIANLIRSICKKQKLREIYPYLIRHKVLSSLRDKNINEKIASAYGGHSVSVSARYVHLKKSKIKEIILEQVYNVKEPTIKERNEFKKELEKANKRINFLMKGYAKILNKFEKKESVKVVNNQFKKV